MHDRTDLHDHCVVDDALLRVDRPEVLDDLEAAVPGLCDVHGQAGVMLTLDHCRRTTGAIFDPCVVEGSDHVLLHERAGLGDRGGPEN
jgi:hypothetical protein